MSDTTIDASIKEYFSKMTKFSQNPTQSAMIIKANVKENKFEIEKSYENLETVEDVSDDVCTR